MPDELPAALAGCGVRDEADCGEHFGLRGICCSWGVAVSFGRFSNAEYPLRSGLWHPLNVSLPPRPPPSGGLQHGRRPAGCAVLLQTRFDRRLDCSPTGDLGGEEGRAADRASTMLEPAARRGAGGSGTFKGCQSLVEGIPGLRLTPSARRDFTMQNDLPLDREHLISRVKPSQEDVAWTLGLSPLGGGLRGASARRRCQETERFAL